MRLTTSRYYTPSGRSIQAKGIEPDIAVRQARLEELDAGSARREADLRGALDQEREEDGESADASDGEQAPETRDYQLARALDLLRGLALFNERVVN